MVFLSLMNLFLNKTFGFPLTAGKSTRGNNVYGESDIEDGVYIIANIFLETVKLTCLIIINGGFHYHSIVIYGPVARFYNLIVFAGSR